MLTMEQIQAFIDIRSSFVNQSMNLIRIPKNETLYLTFRRKMEDATGIKINRDDMISSLEAAGFIFRDDMATEIFDIYTPSLE